MLALYTYLFYSKYIYICICKCVTLDGRSVGWLCVGKNQFCSPFAVGNLHNKVVWHNLHVNVINSHCVFEFLIYFLFYALLSYFLMTFLYCYCYKYYCYMLHTSNISQFGFCRNGMCVFFSVCSLFL